MGTNLRFPGRGKTQRKGCGGTTGILGVLTLSLLNGLYRVLLVFMYSTLSSVASPPPPCYPRCGASTFGKFIDSFIRCMNIIGIVQGTHDINQN